MARHAIHVSEVLDVAIQTMGGLQQHQKAIHQSLFPDRKNYTEYAKEYTSFQLQTLKSLKSRSDSNLERLKNEITLVKESRPCSCCYGHSSLQLQAFNIIARKDNAVVRSIAMLTMVFLPATFITVRMLWSVFLQLTHAVSGFLQHDLLHLQRQWLENFGEIMGVLDHYYSRNCPDFNCLAHLALSSGSKPVRSLLMEGPLYGRRQRKVKSKWFDGVGEYREKKLMSPQ